MSPLFSLIETMEEERIKGLAQELLEEHKELFLVDVKVKGTVGNQKVLVFVDGDEGISIDQCGHVSRQLGTIIEELDLFGGKYTLEVSSPGLDFPLTLHRQYVKNVGREVLVELTDGMKFEGMLEKVSEDAIELKSGKETKLIALDQVKQTKVKVSFK